MTVAVPATIVTAAIIGTSVQTDDVDSTPALTAHTTAAGDPASYVSGTRSRTEPVSDGTAASQVQRRLAQAGAVSHVSTTSHGGQLEIQVDLDRVDDDLTSSWHAELAAGAYAELVHTDERAYSELVASAVASEPGANGRQDDVALGSGAARLGQEFDSPPDDLLRKHVSEVAQQFGLGVSQLQILHPLESAIEVTFVVPDNARVEWTISQLSSAIIGKSPNVEGILIQLVSTNGQALLRTTSAFRVGAGGLWFAPGQDDRFSAIHGHGPWD